MSVQELVNKYSTQILDTTNPTEQDKALSMVIKDLLNELNNNVIKNKCRRKKEIKMEIENSNKKYVEFVLEINKLAERNLLRSDGFKMITDKQFRFFL